MNLLMYGSVWGVALFAVTLAGLWFWLSAVEIREAQAARENNESRVPMEGVRGIRQSN